MRLLIGGSPSKFFHLKEFSEQLKKNGVDCKLVIDTEIYAGFPSKKMSDWFYTSRNFKKIITEFEPNAIFVDRQTNFGLAAIKANIPLFVHLRGNYWAESKMAKETLYKYPPKRQIIWFKEKIADKCFKGARTILPICKYLENVVKNHYPEKPTEVLYQGINPSNWYYEKGLESNHPCVGLLQSAIIWDKTREMLTITKAIESMPNVTFYWVGNGPYKEKIIPILEKYSNFKWLGSLQYPTEVRKFLSEIDVYALASGIDMSPLTLQEAQLMKKPVIATNVGGIPELMENDETGFLVEKGDYKGWIDKISILLNDQDLCKSMGSAGRHFIEKKFSWDVIARKFIDVLNSGLK